MKSFRKEQLVAVVPAAAVVVKYLKVINIVSKVYKSEKMRNTSGHHFIIRIL